MPETNPEPFAQKSVEYYNMVIMQLGYLANREQLMCDMDREKKEGGKKGFCVNKTSPENPAEHRYMHNKPGTAS